MQLCGYQWLDRNNERCSWRRIHDCRTSTADSVDEVRRLKRGVMMNVKELEIWRRIVRTCQTPCEPRRTIHSQKEQSYQMIGSTPATRCLEITCAGPRYWGHLHGSTDAEDASHVAFNCKKARHLTLHLPPSRVHSIVRVARLSVLDPVQLSHMSQLT